MILPIAGIEALNGKAVLEASLSSGSNMQCYGRRWSVDG